MGNLDVVKVWFTYLIIGFVVVAGFAFLFLTRNDATVGKDTVALVSGFIAAGLTFLTNQVVQSQTAHQTNVAASTLTSSTPPPGTTTTTTTSASIDATTVTPPDPVGGA